MIAITCRQREILDFIERFMEERRYSPSYEEMAKGLGLKSLATVHKHVHNLQAKGLLKKGVNRNRSIETVDPSKLKRFQFIDGKLWDKELQCYWVKEKV